MSTKKLGEKLDVFVCSKSMFYLSDGIHYYITARYWMLKIYPDSQWNGISFFQQVIELIEMFLPSFYGLQLKAL